MKSSQNNLRNCFKPIPILIEFWKWLKNDIFQSFQLFKYAL